MMNLKMRLEKLCDSKSWVKLHFADGATLTGRVLRVGHDYIELECYGNGEKPGMPEYAKHLVPLHLVKYLTIDSSSFAQAERLRLDYLSGLDISSDSMPELEK